MSGSRRSAMCRSTTTALRSRPTRSFTTRKPNGCMRKAMSGWTSPTARSPTAKSSTSATISATASSTRSDSTVPTRPASPPPVPTARAAISPSSRAASILRVSRARTIPRSRRNGRSRRPGSSTIKTRRWSISRTRGSSSSAGRSPGYRISRFPILRRNARAAS